MDRVKTDPTLVAPLRMASALAGASLEIVRSPDPERVGTLIPLAPGETTIGRAGEATVVVRDPGISRLHLRVTTSEHGQVTLADVQSRNGTLLNGLPVLSCSLREGDQVQVGATVLRFLRAEAPPLEPTVSLPVPCRLECTRLELALGVEIRALLDFPPRLEGKEWAPLVDLVEPVDAEAVRARVIQPQAFTLELRVRPRGTRPTWLALTLEAGAGPVRVGTLTDVTARKRAEQELRRLAHTFSALYDGVAILDLELRVQDWSSSAERLFKIPRDEAVGAAYPELMGLGTEAAAARAIGAALAHQGRWSQELRVSGRLVEAVLAPVTDSEGVPIASIAVHRDLTEQRATQAQLLLANRLSSVGTLAAGVAHEINNPLSFIHANLAFLAERLAVTSPFPDLEERHELAQVVGDSREGVDRIAGIVRDLKRLSLPDTGSTTAAVDVVRALRLALRMAHKQIDPVARLTEEIAEVPRVRGNEGRLEQVFLNLLVNAAQAVQPGRPNEIRVVCRREGERRVVVEVQDTGNGIDPELRDRIFDPFFTTKGPGQGTGLGLSICHSIVQAMGGVISVDSELGKGTTVRVELATSGEVEQVTETARMAMGPPRRGRVLLVDDEPMVLTSLRRLLERAHDVTCAASWAEVRDLHGGGARFDVILSDVMMPETSGLGGYQELCVALPDQAARLAFMTGGVYVAALEAELEATGRPLLGKPVDAGKLAAVLADLLALPPA